MRNGKWIVREKIRRFVVGASKIMGFYRIIIKAFYVNFLGEISKPPF
jgi:hypothetical protein